MQRESLHGTWQRVLHLVGLLAGWALFIYWWYLVAVAHWNKSDVALIIFATLGVSPLVTLGWVAHNLGIFRRRGPRLGQPVVEMAYARDWNGRRVDADWQALRESGLVVVTLDGASKRYVDETPVSPRRPVRAPVVETEPA